MVRIRVLGELSLEVDGSELAPPAGRPARALLGWLSLHPGRHRRSQVAGRLWPDVLESSARASLRTALSDVRRVLGPAAERALVATRDGIGLAGEPDVWIDALAFDALAAAGRQEEALALCRGELLTGLDDGWVLAARDEHRGRRGEALAALADAAEAAGDRGEALRCSRRRAALDPFDEPAHRVLMRRLAAAGDRGGALAVYERLAGRLRRELAVAPSPQTRAAAEALRRGQEDAAGQSAPSGAAALPRSPPTHPRPLPSRLALARWHTAFVGRSEPLRRLSAQWQEARAGRRRLAFVAGEPGIGKTRLAAQLARDLGAEQATVLYGRAEEEALVPYQPFVEALRQAAGVGPGRPEPQAPEVAALVPELVTARAVGDVVAAGPSQATRLRLFEAVVATLDAVALERPLLLVLDDLHWADRPTLRLLVHAATRPEPAAVLMVGMYRHTDLSPGHPLEETIADLRREIGFEQVTLEGLAGEEVAAVLEQWAGTAPERGSVDRLRAATGGNPFFIQEVVHHLHESGQAVSPAGRLEVPEGVKQVVARRVARLGSEVGGLLAAGAVAGPEFDLELTAEVEGVPLDAALDALEAALRGGLIAEVAETPGRYAFAHALVRETLVGSLTAGRRVRLHGLLAATLERRAEADPDLYLAQLAHHALEAVPIGDPERAVGLAERAAARMAAVHAHEEAAQLLDRALAVSESRGGRPGRRAELLCSLGEALQPAGATDRARGAFDRASELARSIGHPELLARAALGAGGLGVTIAEVDRSLVERLEEALAALGESDDGLGVRLLGRLAIELAYDPDRRRGEEASHEAVARARRLREPGALAAALSARHVALWAPDHTQTRLDCATEMLELARRAGDRRLALQARNWRVLDLFELGEGSGVRAELDAYAALAADVRLPAYSWYVPLWRATLAVLEGRLDEGIELGRRAREAGGRAGDANADVFWRELQHTRLLADERLDDAPMLEYTERQAERSPARLAYRATLAWHLAELGREGQARHHLDMVAADGFAHVPRDMNWFPAMASAAQACARLGDVERAGELRGLLEPYAALNVVSGRASGHYGSVAFLLARLAATVGDLDAADDLYAEAQRRDQRAGSLVWLIRDLRHHAELLLVRGNTERAHELLARAESQGRRAGLTGALEKVRAALALVTG